MCFDRRMNEHDNAKVDLAMLAAELALIESLFARERDREARR